MSYVDIPVKVLKENIINSRKPKEVTELLKSIAESKKAGKFDFVDNALEKLIGRKLTDLNEFLKNIYSK